MSLRRLAASLLASAVIGLTASAGAQTAAPADAPVAQLAPAEPAPAAAPSTPLALRPSKPLELSKEPEHTGSTGWKIVAVMALLGGAALWARRRAQPRILDDAMLTIVRRTPVGFRSELVVVDVEGQRLLLGVTPHTIQSLAVLDGDEALAAAARVPAASAAMPAGERFAALLDGADRRAPPRSRPEAPAAPAVAPEERPVEADDVAGQARGLLALRGRR